MANKFSNKAPYLHDAIVHSICLTIDDSGNRCLTFLIHCHPDCGYSTWDDKKLQIDIMDPLVISGDMYGHMANSEEINSIDFEASDGMLKFIKRHVDAGIAPPKQVVSILFHSGSQLDIASGEIRVSVLPAK